MKGNRKSTKIVEYQLICIDYRWICINYQALVLETFFCLSKRWLFLICDIILDYREALVFYRIFSTLVINFFEFLKFGSKSIEKSIENRYQSTSVTVNFTDNRDYRAALYSMGGAAAARRGSCRALRAYKVGPARVQRTPAIALDLAASGT